MIDLTKLSDLEILTLTLIGEARGEPIEGQVAVASVIRNRALTQHKTFDEICLAPKQFSCWNEHDPNRVLLEDLGQRMLLGNALEVPSYIQCQYVARGIIKNEILDNTHGALNYLTIELYTGPNKPSWAKDVNFVVSKGNQVFFTPRDRNDSSTTKA